MKRTSLFGEAISKRKHFIYINPKDRYQKFVEVFFSRNIERPHQTKEYLLKEAQVGTHPNAVLQGVVTAMCPVLPVSYTHLTLPTIYSV